MTGLDLNNLLALAGCGEPPNAYGDNLDRAGWGGGYGDGPARYDADGFDHGGSSTPELINTGHAPEKASLT